MSSTPFRKTRQIRQRDDVLISKLPSSTVRWIKSRRALDNAQHRVVVSESRITKLREIFDCLDYERRGFIKINDIILVEKYAKSKNVDIETRSLIQHIMELFIKTYKSEKSVTTTIDYQQIEIPFKDFMITMTGNSRSIIEKSNEDEFEKLRHCFQEYAQEKTRFNSTNAIMNQINHQNGSNTTTTTTTNNTNHALNKTADLKVYSNFLTLLNNTPAESLNRTKTRDNSMSMSIHSRFGNKSQNNSRQIMRPEINDTYITTGSSSSQSRRKIKSEFDEIESRLETIFVDLDPAQLNKIVSSERNFFNKMNDLNNTLNSINNNSNNNTNTSINNQLSNTNNTSQLNSFSFTKTNKYRTWIPSTDNTVAKSGVKIKQKAIIDARKCHTKL